jgi:hypothetical protein
MTITVKYHVEDGSIFDTMEEAQAWERKLSYAGYIGDVIYQNCDLDRGDCRELARRMIIMNLINPDILS